MVKVVLALVLAFCSAGGEWVAEWADGEVLSDDVRIGVVGVRGDTDAVRVVQGEWESHVEGDEIVAGAGMATWMVWVKIEDCDGLWCGVMTNEGGLEIYYASGMYWCKAGGKTVGYPATGGGWDLVVCGFSPAKFFLPSSLSISVNFQLTSTDYVPFDEVSGTDDEVVVGSPGLTAEVSMVLIAPETLSPLTTPLWERICCSNHAAPCPNTLRCSVNTTMVPESGGGGVGGGGSSGGGSGHSDDDTPTPIVITSPPHRSHPDLTYQPLSHPETQYRVVPVVDISGGSGGNETRVPTPAPPPPEGTPRPAAGDTPSASEGYPVLRLVLIVFFTVLCLGCIYCAAPAPQYGEEEPVVPDDESESAPGSPTPFKPQQQLYPDV